MDKATISAVMAAMGRKGGIKGGKRSMETMTPEERSARAKKASLAGAAARAAKAAAKKAAAKKAAKQQK
jgi:hypothetical protein